MARNPKLAIEVEIKNIKKIADLKNELKQLRKEQKKQEAESKSGRLQSHKDGKAYKDRAKAIKENSKSLRTLNKDMAGATKATKSATKSNNGMAKQFVKGAAAIGVAVAAFKTISSAISNSIESFTQFEFQMAKVKAITGANRTEFLLLSKTAQDLGRSTFFTAQQVAELQTNYGKLGFTTDEIIAAQEATLNLATATDTDLARAAIVAGSAVRGFGLDASETQRVVDVMAVAFTSSALDIEKWQTSMTKVAPIAKSAGFSIEDTAAIMAQLSDSGIEASIAGTSLRNILLKMQDPNSDLVKSFGKTIHSLDELVPAMAKFSEEGGSLAEIMEIVDVRQVSTFEQMITSRKRTLDLRDALKDANGAAEEMARIVGSTLEGALKRSTSAWQGFQIAFVDNFGEELRKITDGFASFMNKLTDFVEIPVSEKLEKDRTSMNNLFNALKETNISQDTRNKLLVKLNLEYGEYLPNIITEKTSLEDLKVAQVEANAALLQRVTILAAEEKLVNIRKKQIDNEIEALDLEVEKQEALNFQIKARAETNDRLAVSLNSIDNQMTNANMSVNENTEDLRRNKEEAEKLAGEYATAAAAATNLGSDVDALVESLNISTTNTNESTDAIVANTKAKEQNLDVEREMVELLMNQGVTSKEEEARIQKYLNGLREKEIELQLKSLNEFVMNVDLRKKLLLELNALQADTDEDEQKRKDDSFQADVKRAIMSGQTAEEAMKTVVRAQIMEAVSGYIASIFKSVPFPFNLILAAGAAAAVGGLVDKTLANFGDGGMIEEFADGGMVHGASHANGGVKFAVGGRVNELEGGEAVINKRSTAMFRNQLSSMNEAGGGVKFADGGLMSSPSFTEAQFGANNQSAMMGAMGGQRKVVVVEADITDSQSTVSIIQANATF